jgi:hypothetical protein
MKRVEVLWHMFGPLSMSSWADDFPDSIREGRVGRATRADLETDRETAPAVVAWVDQDQDQDLRSRVEG